jgi:hypothetical protein
MVLLSQGLAGLSVRGSMSYLSEMWESKILSRVLAKNRPGLDVGEYQYMADLKK